MRPAYPARRRLDREGVACEALDNGFESRSDPAALQEVCDRLGPADVEALLRKWLARLPDPWSDADRDAGYGYELWVLQAEVSLTQVLDRPVTGRALFEEVIRENLDLGRPDQVALIFERRVTRRTPGRFRARVITEGVTPSLHVDYKSSRIKQHPKEGRALRTETVINDTRDFAIGKRLVNLPALREVGASASRRLLDVQRLGRDPMAGADALAHLTGPALVDGQRASALRLTDERAQALLSVLPVFRLQPSGFRAADLRAHLAPLLGLEAGRLGQGRLSCELRRLRLHGLVERIPRSHRYRVTPLGLRTAVFATRTHARLLRPAFAELAAPSPIADAPLRQAFERLERAIDTRIVRAGLAP